ncbi:MAG: 23S rRNA (guanosine(2251)-2'-O)-methyltransferase RlmB [Saccharofermentanaceae bacterium]|jgi:23S rRNA (guanosine2251-2'-O)-methyltransferase|nr:23S rRNA (guanosine(2251)-2'-O)-methyltransferase RlmB [Clostridia bacterium]NLX68393.1 23S rRNA (guanosine(2251)-2'-O)-methyltransferase RlmB [Clostridiaceae bacterium]HOO49284.1 23S rRNA (guanosine(2251)-2'-O)-methyltransferase RlmB [Saccharofermentans sp.]HPE28563.1 23S rRNA (guanosine(2251)-2'-O)-methyltransferase RlmB [Saccharofermentans sp.]HPG63902.1 23S rRNA (guanosine(2251)-2'-O)-methyltransferase RlmB [Saccharofermentans sp.]
MRDNQVNRNSNNQNDDGDNVNASLDKIEGKNAVFEALRSGREINKLWVLNPAEGSHLDSSLAAILSLANDRKIAVMRVPRQSLDRISTTHNHQGVIAAVASHEYVEVSDIINVAKEADHAPLIVILDGLKDAYNLGSLLRISDAAGVDGIIIPKHRSIGLDSLVAKASAGAIEYVPVARVTNIAQTIRDLKDQGFWVCGTDASATTMYDKADYSGSMAIVIGSEGEGMRSLVRESCDFLVSIPMGGHVNSLNAAVAAGIVIFEATKKRKEGEKRN